MAKGKRLKNYTHVRNNNHRFTIKHGAFRYPDNVIDIVLNPIKKGANIVPQAHVFCSHCGREISYYHPERERPVMVDNHVRVMTDDGEVLFYCLPYERCMKDRKTGILSQRIKVNKKQYTGKVRDYELHELWG